MSTTLPVFDASGWALTPNTVNINIQAQITQMIRALASLLNELTSVIHSIQKINIPGSPIKKVYPISNTHPSHFSAGWTAWSILPPSKGDKGIRLKRLMNNPKKAAAAQNFEPYRIAGMKQASAPNVPKIGPPIPV
jgi:hypothetical protein